MLSTLVIDFLPRSKPLLIYFMAAVTICSDFGAQKNKVSHCFHCFSIYLSWSDGTGCHDHSFVNVEFSANFFIILFHFHQEALYFFSAFCQKCSVIFLYEVIYISPTILIPAGASSSLAFFMMYSAYKLNKQGDNRQPWCTLFLIWNKSNVTCPVYRLQNLYLKIYH